MYVPSPNTHKWKIQKREIDQNLTFLDLLIFYFNVTSK